VLHPVDGGRTALGDHRPPGGSDYVLHRTAELLRAHPAVILPDDIPALIAQLEHPGPDGLTAALYGTHQAEVLAAVHPADTQSVPPPQRVGSLADLHRRQTPAGQAATRDGDRDRRLLPCFRQPGGRLTLDARGSVALPPGPRLKSGEVRLLLDHVVSVPAAWADGPLGQDSPRHPQGGQPSAPGRPEASRR
jgi:hypothetical protein